MLVKILCSVSIYYRSIYYSIVIDFPIRGFLENLISYSNEDLDFFLRIVTTITYASVIIFLS